jgi:hypothetical protein
MKSQEKRLLHGILILVLLAMSLSACSPDKESTDESVSEISGTQTDVPPVSVMQIEQIRQKVRESELDEFPKAMWSAVNWLEDSTRIVVHIRIDGLENPEFHDRFCDLAANYLPLGSLHLQSRASS